jgi:hypothetical protein
VNQEEWVKFVTEHYWPGHQRFELSGVLIETVSGETVVTTVKKANRVLVNALSMR